MDGAGGRNATAPGGRWAAMIAASVTAAVAIGAGWAAPVGAQSVRVGELELELTGRVQVQLNSTSIDEAEIGEDLPATAFAMRRARLGTGFAYGEWITGEVEADFAGTGASLTDAYIDLALTDGVSIQVGQFKKPFGLIELESSTKIRTVERGVRIRGLEELVGLPAETQYLLDETGYLGRQIGVMAHGGVGALGISAGVFNGEGANTRETKESKAYAARATYAALDLLELGAGVSVQPTGGFEGDDELYGTAIEIDATWGEFRRPGLHAKAEWMRGENGLTATVTELPSMTGVHGLVAWFAPTDGRVEGIEPVFRLSWADPNDEVDGDQGLLLTPGVNLYFNDRNRLMLNGDVYLPGRDDLDPVVGLIAQLQVYF